MIASVEHVLREHFVVRSSVLECASPLALWKGGLVASGSLFSRRSYEPRR